MDVDEGMDFSTRVTVMHFDEMKYWTETLTTLTKAIMQASGAKFGAGGGRKKDSIQI